MQKSISAAFVVLMAAALPPLAWGQAAQTAPKPLAHVYPRGSATDVSNSDIETVVKKTAGLPTSDQNIKTMDIGGLYQLEIGVVHRLKQQQAGDQVGSGALEHLQITEIYHVMSGGGTFVTGGTLDNASEVAPDSALATTLTGRSSRGRIHPGSGQSRRVGPGDVVVLPPNTPHVFTEVDDSGIVYMVVRVDPHYVLPKNYVNDAIKK